MTAASKNKIKANLPLGISITTLITVVGLSFNTGEFKTELRKDIDNNTNMLIDHKKDLNLHMPFQSKIEVFVPRIELDSRMDNIEKTLKRIEEKIR